MVGKGWGGGVVLMTDCVSLYRLVECCFAFTESVGLLGTGTQDGDLDFHTPPEL